MILITRPHPEAEKFANLLNGKGIATLIDPMLTIAFIESGPTDLDNVQALIFTSANGVQAYARLEARRDIQIFTVGAATSSMAQERGFVNIQEAEGNVQSLGEQVVGSLDPRNGKIIHFCGRHVSGNLSKWLQSRGFDSSSKVLYAAQAATSLSLSTRLAFESGNLKTVAFFSPRTAEIFVKLLSGLHLTKNCLKISTICLSNGVAEALREINWQAVEVAEQLTTTAMVDLALRIHYDRTNGKRSAG